MKELALHILDIIQNSISAKASEISVVIEESNSNNLLKIEISDNGKGMSPEVLAKVTGPFYTTRTTRDIGLGIPLFKQAAELCNGNFTILSEQGIGTSLLVTFPLNHIDRQPIGDIAGVLVQVVSSYETVKFEYKHVTDYSSFTFNSKEIRENLGEIPLTDLKIVKFLKEMITENIALIHTKQN